MAASEPTSRLFLEYKILFALNQLLWALTSRRVVPLSTIQLNRISSLPASTLPANLELDRIVRLYAPTYSICTLPHWLTLPRLYCGTSRWEPAIAWLDKPFTPKPKSEERIYAEPLQTSTTFYSGFILLRFSSSGFWSYPSDSSRTQDAPRRNCAHFAFATPHPLRVKLATKIHSPLRCSKRTVQLLKAAPYYHLLFSSSFHSLLWELFSVPSRYYSLSVLANI